MLGSIPGSPFLDSSWISWMVSNLRPFIRSFSLGKRKKSQGARSGEYGGWGTTVGVATGYGLDGPGIESRWKSRFSVTDQTGPGAHPVSCTIGLLPWGKAAGAWLWPPTPSSAGVKERVELCLYSLYGPSWPVIGWSLTSLYTESSKRFVKMCDYKLPPWSSWELLTSGLFRSE